MENRFYLKNWSIGMEIPFPTEGFSKGIEALQRSLVDSYCNWFDCLNVQLPYLEMPNGNMMLLFTITVMVDSDLVNSNESWDEMKISIEASLKKFLEDNNVKQPYRILYAE